VKGSAVSVTVWPTPASVMSASAKIPGPVPPSCGAAPLLLPPLLLEPLPPLLLPPTSPPLLPLLAVAPLLLLAPPLDPLSPLPPKPEGVPELLHASSNAVAMVRTRGFVCISILRQGLLCLVVGSSSAHRTHSPRPGLRAVLGPRCAIKSEVTLRYMDELLRLGGTVSMHIDA
jgi:hypothetical protein